MLRTGLDTHAQTVIPIILDIMLDVGIMFSQITNLHKDIA